MTTKKDLVIVILATFCLTLTLFVAMPTRSAGTYDPWLDVNDDGIIEMMDFFELSNAFGASGDPTRNVNVTNWQPSYRVLNYTAHFEWITETSLYYATDCWIIDTTGYSRMFIYIKRGECNTSEPCDVTIYLNGIQWYPIEDNWSVYSLENFSPDFLNFTHYEGGWYLQSPIHKAIEVKGQYAHLGWFCDPISPVAKNGTVTFDVYVYLRNE